MSSNLDYPLPSYAASIWHRGDALALGLPSLAQGLSPRTLLLPLERCSIERSPAGSVLASQRGWETLLALLAERSRLGALGIDRPMLGTPGEPLAGSLAEALRGAKSFDARRRLKLNESDLWGEQDGK